MLAACSAVASPPFTYLGFTSPIPSIRVMLLAGLAPAIRFPANTSTRSAWHANPWCKAPIHANVEMHLPFGLGYEMMCGRVDGLDEADGPFPPVGVRLTRHEKAMLRSSDASHDWRNSLIGLAEAG